MFVQLCSILIGVRTSERRVMKRKDCNEDPYQRACGLLVTVNTVLLNPQVVMLPFAYLVLCAVFVLCCREIAQHLIQQNPVAHSPNWKFSLELLIL